MIINGQMKKYDFTAYYEQLKSMPEPISLNELPKEKLDLREISEYARKKGTKITNQSENEKQLFMKKKYIL